MARQWRYMPFLKTQTFNDYGAETTGANLTEDGHQNT